MIIKIKNSLKTIVQTVTGISDDFIYLSAMDEAAYKIQPWASILTQTGTSKKINRKWENFSGIFRIQKYENSLPIVLALAGESEAQVSAWELDLLKALPPYFIAEDPTGQFYAELSVDSIQHSDFVTMIRDNYQTVFRLNLIYGVYVSEDDFKNSPVTLG